MKVDYHLVAGILKQLFNEKALIKQKNSSYLFREVVSKLVSGLNDISSIYDQMEFLKEEQAKLDAKHVEETGEIESEMVRLQKKCPHFSESEKDSPNSFRLVTCNTCGMIMEEGMTYGI